MRTPLRTALLVALALVGIVTVVPAHAESSPDAYASRLVSLINNAREQHGLRPLSVTSGTSTVAAGWTQHLAAVQSLSHNPDLGPQLESHGSPNWTTYGENVGEAPSSSADSLFNAYMNSPEHRDNILGSAYRYVGVGVVFSGSTAWNTLDFVDQYASSPTPSSRPAAPRVTHHASTATTTQAAPRPATRATHRTAVAPAAARPAAAPARATARPHKVRVHAARPAPSTAAPVASTSAAVAAVAAEPLAAALPLPVQVPGHRSPLPTLVAFALLALVGGSFGRVLFTRGA